MRYMKWILLKQEEMPRTYSNPNMMQVTEYRSGTADGSIYDESIIYFDVYTKIHYKRWYTSEGNITKWYVGMYAEE